MEKRNERWREQVGPSLPEPLTCVMRRVNGCQSPKLLTLIENLLMHSLHWHYRKPSWKIGGWTGRRQSCFSLAFNKTHILLVCHAFICRKDQPWTPCPTHISTAESFVWNLCLWWQERFLYILKSTSHMLGMSPSCHQNIIWNSRWCLIVTYTGMLSRSGTFLQKHDPKWG